MTSKSVCQFCMTYHNKLLLSFWPFLWNRKRNGSLKWLFYLSRISEFGNWILEHMFNHVYLLYLLIKCLALFECKFRSRYHLPLLISTRFAINALLAFMEHFTKFKWPRSNQQTRKKHDSDLSFVTKWLKLEHKTLLTVSFQYF